MRSDLVMTLIAVIGVVSCFLGIVFWAIRKHDKHAKEMRKASLVLGEDFSEDIGKSVARHDLRQRILFKDYYNGKK